MSSFNDGDPKLPKSANNRRGWCFDTLYCLLFQGPVWDGDVPSKAGRDDLIERGWAVRVVVAGRDGYTAATYAGREAICQYKGVATLQEIRNA